MMKSFFSINLIVIVFCMACREANTRKLIGDLPKIEKQPLGTDFLTLTPFSEDTNSIHVSSSTPSGDLSLFYFKQLDTSRTNSYQVIRGVYVKVKSSENKFSQRVNSDSFFISNYNAFAFQITNEEWRIIKSKAKEIEANVDSTYINSFCEFCPNFIMVYNGKMIENKLVKEKKVKGLFDYLLGLYSRFKKD